MERKLKRMIAFMKKDEKKKKKKSAFVVQPAVIEAVHTQSC